MRFCPGQRWEDRVDLALTLLAEVKGQKCTRRGAGSRSGAWIQWAVAADTAEEPGDTWALAREEPEAWAPQSRVALMTVLFPKDKQLGLLGLLVT